MKALLFLVFVFAPIACFAQAGSGNPNFASVQINGISVNPIASNQVFYIETSGSDATAIPGNPAFPYQSGSAAFVAAYTTGSASLLKFGVGNWTIVTPFGVDWPAWIQVIGAGSIKSTTLSPPLYRGFYYPFYTWVGTITGSTVILGGYGQTSPAPGNLIVGATIPSNTFVAPYGVLSNAAIGTTPYDSGCCVFQTGIQIPTTLAIYGYSGDVAGVLPDGVTADPNGAISHAGNLTIIDVGKHSFCGAFRGGYLNDYSASGNPGNAGSVLVFDTDGPAFGGDAGAAGISNVSYSGIITSGTTTMINATGVGWGSNANYEVASTIMINCVGPCVGGQNNFADSPAGPPDPDFFINSVGEAICGQGSGAQYLYNSVTTTSADGPVTMSGCTLISTPSGSPLYDLSIAGNPCTSGTDSAGLPSSNVLNENYGSGYSLNPLF